MNRKYVIDYLYRNYFNAVSKPREDINVVAQKVGYELFYLKIRTTREVSENKKGLLTKYLHRIKKLLVFFDALFKIKNNSVVLIQYPLSPFGNFLSKYFCLGLRKKSCRLIILVHDIAAYRETGYIPKSEIGVLNLAHHIILHTPAMQVLFNRVEIKPPMSSLYLFDYLTEEYPIIQNTICSEVSFAGNLEKSTFLHHIHKISFKKLKINLYGLPTNQIKETNEIRYCGKFSPEKINAIKGNWGLVWDGESLDTCSGLFGNYLQINSPHKTSLYLAAGIPIIVWKQSDL